MARLVGHFVSRLVQKKVLRKRRRGGTMGDAGADVSAPSDTRYLDGSTRAPREVAAHLGVSEKRTRGKKKSTSYFDKCVILAQLLV